MTLFSNYFFFSFFYFIIFTFTHMCIHCLDHLHPPHPTDSRQNLFSPLVLQFWWTENIRDNKNDIVIMLVWDKDGHIERFLVLLPCTCVLVHLYQISSLLPGPLPIVASASLRLLYLLLYSEHINHIQVLGFLPFPHPSQAHSPLTVWLMSNNITAFVLGLQSAYEEEHVIFGLLSLANFA
jgi:hypothetical protein